MSHDRTHSAYRVIFAMAAVYNVAFGLWAGLFPLAFFDWLDLPPPTYPSIWACLGMVVGLYGPLYAYVAWKPEQGDLIAAIGLAGKVLGPLGWLMTMADGELPPRTFVLVLFNDLIWWFPFAFYLLRRTAWRRTILAGTLVVAHLLACLALLWCSPGTETNPDMADRASWVAAHPTAWVVTWFLWAISSLSLPAFCIAWAGRLSESGAPARAAIIGCCIIVSGLFCDLTGEVIQIARATAPDLTIEQSTDVARWYTLLGPGAANGLYCVGGLVLSILSWRCGFLHGPWGMVGFAMWGVGLLLTLAAVADHRLGMFLTGAGVMGLFLPWAVVVGWRLRPSA